MSKNLSEDDRKYLEKRLDEILPQLKIDCQQLKIHLKICPYCRGFVIALLEQDWIKNKWK